MPKCAQCEEEFERPAKRGPAPKYCSDAHRQAAFRSRHHVVNLAARVLRRRAQIVEVAAQRGASNVRLFGSVARGETTATSDVDFLVDLEPNVSLVGLAGLERELAELLECDVDVVPAAHLKVGVLDIAHAEAIAL